MKRRKETDERNSNGRGVKLRPSGQMYFTH